MLNSNFLTVSEVNSYIKTYLENNYFLSDIYVKGEISNFKRHQTGTFYFSIKDATSKINVVMFSSYANKVKDPLKDGSLVLIRGHISVYEAAGNYQIIATELSLDSIGQLYLEYERLKKQLEAEGLFDEKYKKALPAYPNKIGIITAPKGAAIHDMLNTIQHRWPLADVILFPSLVQGIKAAEDIVKNIQLADQYDLDVIICGRGGGSIEDLWPFNEEIVARAIFHCKTPIISAIGHQSDYTIADFVADKRGLTPTDGAVLATPKKETELEKISNQKKLLLHLMTQIINQKKTLLAQQKKAYIFQHPQKLYETYRLKLEHLEKMMMQEMEQKNQLTRKDIETKAQTLIHSFQNLFNQKRYNFTTLMGKLDALSPLKILKRGYGALFKENHNVKSIHEIQENDLLSIRLADGKIVTKVIHKEEK